MSSTYNTLLLPGFLSGATFNVFEKNNTIRPSFENIKQECSSYMEFLLNENITIEKCSLLPHKFLQLYRETQKYCNTENTLLKLNKIIFEFKPNVVYCHSLGCFLFERFLNSYSFPKSVEKVVYINADTPTISDSKIQNYFSPCDFALLVSMATNRYLPVGLFGNSQHPNNILIKHSFSEVVNFLKIHAAYMNSIDEL